MQTSYNSDPAIITDSATPLDAFTIFVPDGNTCRVQISVFARGYSDGASALWSIQGGVKRVNGVLAGIPAGIVQMFAARKDVAAATWDVTFVFNPEADSIIVRVTGSATQSVGWTIDGSVFGFSNVNNGGIV